jgi:hypothetical protein
MHLFVARLRLKARLRPEEPWEAPFPSMVITGDGNI